MADLFPGCTVFDPDKGTKVGSLGCFVTKKNKLYAITARHVVSRVGASVFYGSGVGAEKLGTVKRETGKELDAVLIKVDGGVRDDMTADSFLARIGGERLPMYGAAPATEEPLNYIVRHAGQTSAASDDPKYVNNSGTVAMNSGSDGPFGESRLTMEGRLSRPGDSGGPVFTSTGTAVGFISVGMSANPQTGFPRTRIVHFARVMAEFKVIMATWANRNTWRPPSDIIGRARDGKWETIVRSEP